MRRTAFTPLGALYDFGGRVRFALTKPYVAPVPVICVGNVTAGGTGKTPFSITLAHGLKALGHRPHIVTRGYGGSLRGPVQVDPERHTASEVGDEPLLLSNAAPTWIAKNRRAGVEHAVSAGADMIVMDDGLQNPSVAKTVSLVLVDGEVGFGNGRVIPAGPLRESVERCFARADALILMGEESHRTRAQIAGWRGPVFHAHLEPNATHIAPQPYIAFAGIARPDKFFATLDRLGVRMIERVAFPDHHVFTESEIKSLISRAKASNARLITTAKDAVRLDADQLAHIEALPIVATIASREAFGRFLIERLASKQSLLEKSTRKMR
ncbi:MAG: tetraacyldisaccharide 4'-kinase [Alphaproteobacteria bacterium]